MKTIDAVRPKNKLDAVRPQSSFPIFGMPRTIGSFTGWLVDTDTLEEVSHRHMPENFLSVYPRFRAARTNTWFTGFAIVTDGMWLKLDFNGSKRAKRLIMNSFCDSGFWAVVEGIRDHDRIIVKNIRELPKPVSTARSIDDISDDKRWWRSPTR